MRRRRLRVAVDPRLRDLSPRSGHGRVWRSVLRELDALVRLRDPGERADVVLHDGHAAPPATDRPLVAFMSEAPWDDPDALAGVDPAFVAAMDAAARASAAAARRLIVPSRASAEQAARVFGAVAIDVVPHGVDAAVFAAGDAARGSARVGEPYVLFASQLHPRKNLAALREALPGLGRALVVVGGPAADREEDLALQAEALAPVHGTAVHHLDAPEDRDLADLYAGADAVCLPSLFEGFGLTALEAMAAGARLVVSDRGALPEVAGDAAVVVAPDAAAVRAGLQEAFRREDLGPRATERARGFTWARTAAGWHRALELARTSLA